MQSTDNPVKRAPTISVKMPVIFGRGESANVQLQNRWVSRLHCQIDHDDRGFVIRDLNARHGLFVNGRQVAEAVLREGDSIAVGLDEFVCRFQTSEAFLEHQGDGVSVCGVRVSSVRIDTKPLPK